MAHSTRFEFPADLDRTADRLLGVVEVPAGITEKKQLLEVLRQAVPLPDYFGGNWDALDECLRDRLLDGPERPLCLVHRDLPLIGGDSAARTVHQLPTSLDDPDAHSAGAHRDCRDYLQLLDETLVWSEQECASYDRTSGQQAAFTVLFPSGVAEAIDRLLL